MELLIYISLILSCITLIIAVILLIKISKKDSMTKYLMKHTESTLREELSYIRREQSQAISQLEDSIINKLSQISNVQTEQLLSISKINSDVADKMSRGVFASLDNIRQTVDTRIKDIQTDTGNMLEKMRQTVDEKLHKTLEERLGQSFSLVSRRLEEVQKGLGEMKTLAISVGDLKKVLSNVKTRGIMGEMQLESILEQILSKGQYEKNVAVNPNTKDVVEFAIKLPGKGNVTYLPIDAKFPIEYYYKLIDAYENSDVQGIEQWGKGIESAIKKCGADISKKYIYPPSTTDFAIMFLPIEGLYAEVVRRPQLLETLQRDYKIVVSGPTTFAALLNSLLMGFNTLSIEKRSREVFNVLSLVKTEFSKFGVVLEKAQRKITDAGSEIDQLVGVRTQKIVSSLNKVSVLDEEYEQKADVENEVD